jgi:hypothetical protein
MRLDSPVEKFPGYIILPDFLNIAQVREFEDTLPDPNAEFDDEGAAKKKRVWLGVLNENKLPVVLNVVREWHIEGIPEKPTIDTFPMTPIKAAHELISWIYNALRLIWIGEEVPNA